MKFVFQDRKNKIGDQIAIELLHAIEVKVAVAYFRPREKTLAALENVRDLKIIVSDEFSVNDPDKLKQLARKHPVLCIPTDDKGGRLHAKVIYGVRRDGTRFAFIGSANLTDKGLFSNQEACVFVDSRRDQETVEAISDWLTELFDAYGKPAYRFDYDRAERIFSNAQTQAKNRIRTSKSTWLLKCRDGLDGLSFWDNFVKEEVIAIGFDERKVLNDSQVAKFEKMQIGDTVLIIGGFPPNKKTDLHILGIARVTGRYRYDKTSNWWKKKHDADIQEIRKYVDIDMARKCLGRKAAHQTIYLIDVNKFASFIAELHKEYGIAVTI